MVEGPLIDLIQLLRDRIWWDGWWHGLGIGLAAGGLLGLLIGALLSRR